MKFKRFTLSVNGQVLHKYKFQNESVPSFRVTPEIIDLNNKRSSYFRHVLIIFVKERYGVIDVCMMTSSPIDCPFNTDHREILFIALTSFFGLSTS